MRLFVSINESRKRVTMKVALTISVLAGLLFFSDLCYAIDITPEFDGRNTTFDLNYAISRIDPIPAIHNTNHSAYSFSSSLYILNSTGQFLEIKPVSTWRDESGVTHRELEMPPDGTVFWKINCSGPGGTAKWYYKGTYSQGQDENSGHFYHIEAPPFLSFSDFHTTTTLPPDSEFSQLGSPYVSPTLLSEKIYYYWQKMPSFATRITDWKETFGACTDTLVTHIDVKVPGLAKMPLGSNYILYNPPSSTPYHQEKFYGVQSLVDALIAGADEYNLACPKAAKMQITAMSLPWGGLFDIGGNWKVPHTTHRYGENADVRKKVIKKKNRAKFIEIMCSKIKDRQVYSEGDAKNEEPHYHLGPRNNSNAPNTSSGTSEDERIVNCCTAPIPDACIVLQSSGTVIPDSTENQPSDCR